MGEILTCISRDQTSHKYQTFQRVNSEGAGEAMIPLDKLGQPAEEVKSQLHSIHRVGGVC